MADLFIRDQERVYGPYAPARIKQLAAAGRITPSWWIGKASHAKTPIDPVLVRRWWGLAITSVVPMGLLVLFTGISLVRPSLFSINARFAVLTIMALVGLADIATWHKDG